jgi:hypothetical protein
MYAYIYAYTTRRYRSNACLFNEKEITIKPSDI